MDNIKSFGVDYSLPRYINFTLTKLRKVEAIGVVPIRQG